MAAMPKTTKTICEITSDGLVEYDTEKIKIIPQIAKKIGNINNVQSNPQGIRNLKSFLIQDPAKSSWNQLHFRSDASNRFYQK